MNSSRKGCYNYILGGITTGTIAAIGTPSHESNNFIYLLAPQIHRDLGGKPLGIVGNAFNKMVVMPVPVPVPVLELVPVPVASSGVGW